MRRKVAFIRSMAAGSLGKIMDSPEILDMPNPWEIQTDLRSEGDLDENTIYTAIGHAVVAWEQLECLLAEVFSAIVSDGKIYMVDPATAAYGSIVGFRGRADMLKAAADVFFKEYPDQVIQSELKSILQDAGRFSARRNEIAHCCIAQNHTGGQIKYLLWPSLYNSTKNYAFLHPKYAMNSKEIMRFCEEFKKLALRASELGPKIPALRKKHQQQSS